MVQNVPELEAFGGHKTNMPLMRHETLYKSCFQAVILAKGETQNLVEQYTNVRAPV